MFQTFSLISVLVGDDAIGVKWIDINKDLKLFASHSDFVKKVAEMHDANW